MCVCVCVRVCVCVCVCVLWLTLKVFLLDFVFRLLFLPFFSMPDSRLCFGLVSFLSDVNARDAVDAAGGVSAGPGERYAWKVNGDILLCSVLLGASTRYIYDLSCDRHN